MKNFIKVFTLLLLGTMAMQFSSCLPAEGNRTGSEFMPDMGPSIAYEANHAVWYFSHNWESKDSLLSYYRNPLLPVKGTVPRGYAGLSTSKDVAAMEAKAQLMAGEPLNGYVPYYYTDTEEERTRAMNEITSNPFPITEAGLATGKALYVINCGICHGDKADGAGYLVRDDGGKYLAAPANLMSDEFLAATEGRYYHAIMFGKNVMGGYQDKLSYEERWQVIHYIRSLQAKAKGEAYTASPTELPTEGLVQAQPE